MKIIFPKLSTVATNHKLHSTEAHNIMKKNGYPNHLYDSPVYRDNSSLFIFVEQLTDRISAVKQNQQMKKESWKCFVPKGEVQQFQAVLTKVASFDLLTYTQESIGRQGITFTITFNHDNFKTKAYTLSAKMRRGRGNQPLELTDLNSFKLFSK